MNTFVSAVNNPITETTNGAVAFTNTSNALVDAFFQLPAARPNGEPFQLNLFKKAFEADINIALRLALWLRDVRGGAGERNTFRAILRWLDTNYPEQVSRILNKIPEVGRWDDLLQLKNNRSAAFSLIAAALRRGDGLCAKWMPREKSANRKTARELMAFMGLSAKEYRKLLANATTVVETKMCANQWDEINFSHVPSKATSIYKDAFAKHEPTRYNEWVAAAVKGEVKVNASAIFPHDVINGIESADNERADAMFAQWNALPDYMNNTKVLPIVDVSGSMNCSVGSLPTSVTCMHVAITLGLYVASRNKGEFKDVTASFSLSPNLAKFNPVVDGRSMKKAYTAIKGREWGMSTDITKVVNLILKTATLHNVAPEDMPSILMILSDMQFDACANVSGLEMIRDRYQSAGYKMPQIVFWNLHASNNAPAKFNAQGVALVGGFSPAILQSVLSGELQPDRVMMKTLMNPRYDV